jgi:hypothetical protein
MGSKQTLQLLFRFKATFLCFEIDEGEGSGMSAERYSDGKN